MAHHLYASIIYQGKTFIASQPLSVLIFDGLVLAGVIWQFWRLHKPGARLGSREIKWAVLLALFVFPLNYLVHFTLFEGEILASNGVFTQPQIFLLGLIPAFAAVGLAGPLPASILALGAGLVQTLMFEQDPIMSLMLVSLTVIFIWQTSRTEAKDSGQSKNSVFINGLLSFLYLLPLTLITRSIISLSWGEKNLLFILEQFSLEASALFPAVLVAAGASHALSRWEYAGWNPFQFILEQEVPNAFSQAVEQLEKLTLGHYDEDLEVKPKSPREAKFYAALSDLRENLRVRQDTQLRLLSLDPSYYSREAYDLLLASILRAALGRDASSARLVLFNPTRDPDRREMRLRIGQGEQTRVYAYLDIMVLEKLGNLDQLILSDIKDDQYFGASEGLPYPQSLVALRLKNNGDAIGVLWVGFDQNHWFSEDDIHFYQQLAYRASAALSTKEQAVKMQAEKAWLEAAFQALADPVLIINRADEILFANAAAAQLLAKEVGSPLRSLKDLQSRMPELSQALKQINPPTEPFRVTIDKGLDYDARIFPIKTQDGQSGRILLLNDTAWQKRINAQKSEFVTNISHDLLSPLQLMRGYVNMLKNIGNLSEEQEKYIGRILLSIENMSGLVSKVISMEMLDSDEEVKPITFDLKDLIGEVVSMLDLQAQQRKVTLHTDFSGLRNPNIVADRMLVRQAVFNLVENAIKFNHMGGEVWVSATKEAANVRIVVKDNGKGIAPLDQPKLFTRYFHIEDGETYENTGPGLGLSIVKSVVEKHGGKISVQSKLGEGSIFTIEIPLKK